MAQNEQEDSFPDEESEEESALDSGYSALGGGHQIGTVDGDDDEDTIDSQGDGGGNGYSNLGDLEDPDDSEEWGDFEAAGALEADEADEAEAEAERIASRLLARMNIDYQMTTNSGADVEATSSFSSTVPVPAQPSLVSESGSCSSPSVPTQQKVGSRQRAQQSMKSHTTKKRDGKKIDRQEQKQILCLDRPIDHDASSSIVSFMATLKPPRRPIAASERTLVADNIAQAALDGKVSSSSDSTSPDYAVKALRASGFFNKTPKRMSGKNVNPTGESSHLNIVAATAVASLASAATAAAEAPKQAEGAPELSTDASPTPLTSPSEIAKFADFSTFPSSTFTPNSTHEGAAASDAQTPTRTPTPTPPLRNAAAAVVASKQEEGSSSASQNKKVAPPSSAQVSVAAAREARLQAVAGPDIAAAAKVVARQGKASALGGVDGDGGEGGQLLCGNTVVVVDLSVDDRGANESTDGTAQAPPPSCAPSGIRMLLCASSMVPGGLRGVCVCPRPAAAALARGLVEDEKMAAWCLVPSLSPPPLPGGNQEEEGSGASCASDAAALTGARALAEHADACRSADCVVVDFGPGDNLVQGGGDCHTAESDPGPAASANSVGGATPPTAAAASPPSSPDATTTTAVASAPLATLAQAVAALCTHRGGVTVMLRGGGPAAVDAFARAVAPSSVSSVAAPAEGPKGAVGAEVEARALAVETTEHSSEPVQGSSSSSTSSSSGEQLVVLAPSQPRNPPSAAAAALEAEEDECWETDFLGSDSDVAEFPGGWICPFLPSPTSRVHRMLEFCGVRGGDHLLDVGCGDGRVLVAAAAAVPGLVCTGVEIDAGLVKRAAAAAENAGVASRCSFQVRDALARVGTDSVTATSDAGGTPTSTSTSSTGNYPETNARAAQRWAVQRDEKGAHWPDGQARRFSVVVLFLVHAALRQVRPLVRDLWSRGGVRVVTLGGYHFEDWAYDRVDFEFGVHVIEPKA